MYEKYFTENAINNMNEIKKYFPKLWKFYDEFAGNFGMTENEVFENMNDVLMWLEKHEDYKLIYQYCEDYDGKNWWLTNFE